MNSRASTQIAGLLVCCMIALAAPQSTLALGTPACTNIGNSATVSFNVSGAAQTPVTSPTNTITVGNRVDVIVTTTDAAPGPSVVSSQTNALLHFTITNNGNSNQRYALSAVNVATGVTTSVFVGNVTVTDTAFVSAGTVTTADAGGTPLPVTATIAPNGTLNVTIRADMGSGLTNNDYDVLALRALSLKVDGTTTEANSASSSINSPAGVCTGPVVLGDGQGTDDAVAGANPDGTHSARSAYHVQLTTLTVNKTSVVYSDPFNGTTNPRSIPGAVMEYTVAVSNSGGSADATNVTITDTLPATLAPNTAIAYTGCGACTGTCVEHPAATFNCRGSWAGQVLTATDPTNLVSGTTATFLYRATIQ